MFTLPGELNLAIFMLLMYCFVTHAFIFLNLKLTSFNFRKRYPQNVHFNMYIEACKLQEGPWCKNAQEKCFKVPSSTNFKALGCLPSQNIAMFANNNDTTFRTHILACIPKHGNKVPVPKFSVKMF